MLVLKKKHKMTVTFAFLLMKQKHTACHLGEQMESETPLKILSNSNVF